MDVSQYPGIFIGNGIGSMLVTKSRKIGTYPCAVLWLLCLSIQMIENPVAFAAGRLINGIAQGITLVQVNRMLEEYAPQHLSPVLIVLNNFFVSLISASSLSLLQLPMPSIKNYPPLPEEIESIKNDGYWRVMVAYPAVFSIISMIFVSIFLKHDTPKSLIIKHRYDEARESIKKIYSA